MSIQRAEGPVSGRIIAGFAVLLLVLLTPARPAAHDIPVDVLVQVFLRAEGQRLHVLVRTPLAAMRDVDFPTRDGIVLLDLRDHDRLDAVLRDAARTWILPALAIFEDGRPLDAPDLAAVRVSLPSDRSFADYDQARAHMTAPKLPAETTVAWNQTLFDVALDYTIASDQSPLAIDPQFGRFGVRVVTVLRFASPGHPERAFEFRGDPGLVRLDPRWHQAALRFVRLGFDHILDGIDHLLFLFCLVIPIRRIRQLVIVVTAFTVAHSITLFAAAFGFAPTALWFPPLIETLIAVSIVYMGLENIVFASGALGLGPGASPHRRWMIAFGFGLVHGFGFSFALQETLQFAGAHVVTSLFAFNVGVELGQLLVLVILVPLLSMAFRYVMPEKIGVIILSAVVVHTAWHWMIERGSTLGQYDWSMDAITLARGLRWTMVGVGAVAAIWLLSTMKTSRAKSGSQGEE
ncbi:MAG TPA: HupE/UreJ family protein [Vicinamibacterales bacterium]|nr:HupE/UreJ family protein [Vicinamibacterales bacterium]